MPKVINLSLSQVVSGKYPFPIENAYLIQIQDAGTWKFANAKNRGKFKGYFQIAFDDIDDGPNAIDEDQAERLAEVLKYCSDRGYDVVVHCHAGICRSGAVTEVMTSYMGYSTTDTHRIPNVRVKRMLIDKLGFGGSAFGTIEQ